MRSAMEKVRSWTRAALIIGCLLLGTTGAAGAMDDQALARMEQLIKQQQAQIEAQAKAIEKLQQQLEALGQNAAREAAAAAKAEVAKATAAPTGVVKPQEGDKVAVKLYGQVNRAVLAVDDGNKTDHYFVDNDNAASRIGILAESKLNEDVTFGTRMEFEYQSNASNLVSQDNKDPDANSFDDRWIDAQITSKRFGKFSIGKGGTASDGTSEIDLSGTAVAGYSSIVDTAGGIFFYDERTNRRSTTSINNVFSSFDDLSRRNRFRYDSPKWMGFGLSGSVLSDGGDVALNYAANWGKDFKVAAAVAYIDPQAATTAIDHVYNGSASILHSSGLNLTVAAGMKDPADTARDNPSFYYGKLGYIAKWFTLGETRFSVDYHYTADLARNGDEARSAGAQVVQDFANWGSEYYMGYRWHELDRDNTDYDDINTLLTGVRLKF